VRIPTQLVSAGAKGKWRELAFSYECIHMMSGNRRRNLSKGEGDQ